MNQQRGFTLFELMIAITVVAILSAIAVPAYQGYIQKAAMTDMLQAMVSYKTEVEFCALENGSVTGCDLGKFGINQGKKTRYLSEIKVINGSITLIGKNSLQGLMVSLTPELEPVSGGIVWQRDCSSDEANKSLITACNDIFRFGG